jgi:hypothetical protein
MPTMRGFDHVGLFFPPKTMLGGKQGVQLQSRGGGQYFSRIAEASIDGGLMGQ